LDKPVSDRILDARNLNCPLPIIRTKRAMATIDIGSVIEVWTTDPGSLADFPAWTELTGHELVASRQDHEVYIFEIRRSK